MKLFLIIILILMTAATDGGRRALEANRAYEQGDYQRAEQLYREILEDHPDSRHILFNLGNALARQGETEASLEVFRRYREITDDPGEQAPAEYNLGYLHGESGNTEEAMRHFRQSLELDPSDEDAKFNFELLKRRQQNEESDDDQDDEDNNQQDQQPQDAQPPPGSDESARPDEEASGQPETTPMDNQPQSDEERHGGRPEITDEQLGHAEDIMNALEQIEKELIKDFKRRQLDPVEPHEKDW